MMYEYDTAATVFNVTLSQRERSKEMNNDALRLMSGSYDYKIKNLWPRRSAGIIRSHMEIF